MPSLSESADTFYKGALTGLPVKPAAGGSSNTTAPTLAATTVATLLTSNAARLGATIYNGSGSPVRVRLGSGASATLFTTILAAGAYYEVPFGYTGTITGFADTASVAPHVLVTSISA